MKTRKRKVVDYKIYKHYDEDTDKVHRITNGVITQLRRDDANAKIDLRVVYNDMKLMGFLLLNKHQKFGFKIGVFVLEKEWTKELIQLAMENALDNFQPMPANMTLASISV